MNVRSTTLGTKPATPPAGADDSPARRQFRFGGRFVAIWIATVLLFVVSGLTVPGSLDSSTLRSLLPFAGALMIASAGQFMVIQAGGLDLSVPGMIGLGAMVVTRYPHLGGGLATSVLFALVAVASAGMLNGLIVVYLRFSPIVATLAVNALLVGVILQCTGGFSYPATHGLSHNITRRPLGVPVSLIVAILAIALIALVLRQTTAGRRLVAVGVNRRAAAAIGIRADLYAVCSYMLGAVCYGIAGVLLAGLLNVPGASVGDSYLILTFAAVVLGGSPLLGGEGSVIATGVGAVFLTQLDQVVLDAGGNTATQFLVQGGVIAASLFVSGVSWRALGRYFRRSGASSDPPLSSSAAPPTAASSPPQRKEQTPMPYGTSN